MKNSIEIQGKVYKTKKAPCDRFGVSDMALRRWAKDGVLPSSIKVGKQFFYDENELEHRLIGLSPLVRT